MTEIHMTVRRCVGDLNLPFVLMFSPSLPGSDDTLTEVRA